MQILESLGDDQIALVGCAGSLLFSGIVMSLSYYLGRYRQSRRISLFDAEDDHHALNRHDPEKGDRRGHREAA